MNDFFHSRIFLPSLKRMNWRPFYELIGEGRSWILMYDRYPRDRFSSSDIFPSQGTALTSISAAFETCSFDERRYEHVISWNV